MAWILAALIAVVIASRWLSELLIEYEWWKEMGQVSTWKNILIYSSAPQLLAVVIAFIVLWIVHARALKIAGTGLREQKTYARLSTIVLILLATILGFATIDGWAIASYYGAQRAGASVAGAWKDPVFGNPVSFYFFNLPFYSQMIGYVVALAILAVIIYWLTARGWMARKQFGDFRSGRFEIDIVNLSLLGGVEPLLLRILVAIVLLGFAAKAFLGRYSFLDDEHSFMVGADYVATNIGIPLQWLSVIAFLLSALLVMVGRWKWAVAPIVLILLRVIVPPIVSNAYVKPNELVLQRPFIQSHIEATRAAYGLDNRLKEIQYPAKLEAPIDVVRHRPVLENLRLWDWRAFHDTTTQLQALRQYYVFADSDVDRYLIDGRMRQVLLAPREMDIRQLPDARANWINGHFIYTHGYGLVMAESSRFNANGQPEFLIEDAPPRVLTKSLKLERPELYYGEVTHEPVFVRTQQAEFNYPSGSDNVQNRYDGKGGIAISGFGMRLAAALAYGDRNILLTGYLTSESRMLIYRNVRERVSKLAGFIDWDADPYLVLTPEGRLVWLIDGYTSSARHPFSRRIRLPDSGSINYIRNSVKAVIDAYDGSVSMYVFDQADPIILAWRAMFPDLFKPAAEMPSDLRAHVRYPEYLFRAQNEIYRVFHMRAPDAFYNKEDLWDIAKTVYSQSASQTDGITPTYVVATLPGETSPEFLLLQSFTPRSKDNLIGVMAARCDPEKYGEIVVLQLSKQSLIYGPLQIEARIDSDPNISKDLTLWNQQGSQVLRGQMLVLPIDNTFLYVEPIYLQSAQARMPQLKKVVLAMGNTLIYRDTFDQALAELGGMAPPPPATSTPTTTSTLTPPVAPTSQPVETPSLDAVRQHLRRYRELSSQGKWSEAGKELEAVEKLVGR